LQRSETKPVLIRFVGDGSRRPGLIARAKAEAIHNVEFVDSMPKSEIQRILHAADAFILNNRADNASKNWMSFSKLYEYLAAGRPVVFGTCTHNDPVRESGAGISVKADDPQALADAIVSLLHSTPDRLAEYGRLGRKHIESFYSIPVLVDRFERMAFEIAGATPALSPQPC
jgi:glycosyltransferase involved in cell wall biosynthesis